jgi:hypothetical protein
MEMFLVSRVPQVAKLSDIFRSDMGRRITTKILKKTMKEAPALLVYAEFDCDCECVAVTVTASESVIFLFQ